MSVSPESEPPSSLSPPESPAESPAASDTSSNPSPAPSATRIPGLRNPSGDTMTHSSTPLGQVNAARRPVGGASALPSSMQAKMRAFHLSRQGAPPAAGDANSPMSPQSPVIPSGAIGGGAVGSPVPGGFAPGSFRLPPGRPQVFGANSAPVVPKMPAKGGLAAKRGLGGGMKLINATGPPATTATGAPASAPTENAFAKYSEFVDTATGTLKFKGKATLHGGGVEFSSGRTFNMSLDEVDTMEELGKGNYGTVYQVRHSRPRMRRPGMGLAGNKAPASVVAIKTSDGAPAGAASGQIMAMKEIRLELDDAKFAAIIMELEVLHKCVSPFIVDFYGAFFQEGAVYICMEFMDGGSIDKLYAGGMPEAVLRKVALATVMGLKALKDEHNIIHRDVKPTNILVNTRGQVKICDFGVSGNLVASIAKTNIGCQSYMAPERISSGGMAQAGATPGGSTYSVQSDIWSLGLTLIECALGQYPYPPETYSNIFSQLSAIVDGDPPDLPQDGFSDQARDFVRSCLHKIPKQRPTYAMLIRHPWLNALVQPHTISEDAEAEAEAEAAAAAAPPAPPPTSIPSVAANIEASEVTGSPAVPETADPDVAAWVRAALARRAAGKNKGRAKPALHAAPLNMEGMPGSPVSPTVLKTGTEGV